MRSSENPAPVPTRTMDLALFMSREFILSSDIVEFPEHQKMNIEWDKEADVVVVGFGGAGAAAAVTAHDLGAKVLMLEKAPEGEEGGNTRVAGQGYLQIYDVDKAITYLNALCGPLRRPANDGARVGRGSEPEQRLGREHRRRSAGAPAPAGRHRVSGAARAPTARTSSTTATSSATRTRGSSSNRRSSAGRSRSSTSRRVAS